MDTSGLQEFMAGIASTAASQSFDIIEKYQPHHHLHHQNHQHHQQLHLHHQHSQQQQQQQHSNTSNHQTSQNNIFSMFEFPYSPESVKMAYNSSTNFDLSVMDASNNDNEGSQLTGETVNSENELNISAEKGRVNFCKDDNKLTKKNLDKDSPEYKKRRERNNVAVRKSREKAKQKSKATEKKVSELQNENDNLKRTVTDLSGKMGVLRRLLDEVGVAKEYVEEKLDLSYSEPHRSKDSSDY